MNNMMNKKRSQDVFEKNYKFEDETIYEMFVRIVNKITIDKEKRKLFLKGLNEGYFVPGGRVMRNIGRIEGKGLPFNCTAIPSPKDDLTDIYNTKKMMVKILQKQAGCGIDFSNLRYKDAILVTSGGRSSGVVSYIAGFDHDVGLIIIGGNRRGAVLGVLGVWHPDIEEFIDSKKDITKMNNMNISVLIDDEFVKAVKEDANYKLRFNGIVTKIIKARDLYDKIIKSNYEAGDCGIFFMDRVKATNNTEYFQPVNIFNACGEIPLPAYRDKYGIVQGICNLTSLNLYNIYKKSESYVHFLNKINKWSYIANDFLDLITDETFNILEDIISVENDKDIIDMFKGIINTQKEARRNGIGIMGLASTFIAMGVKYGSNKSLKVLEDIMIQMLKGSYSNSMELAIEKGCFPAFNYEEFKKTRTYSLLMKYFDNPEYFDNKLKIYGLRNSQILNCPPTGNTSIFAGNVSSGIEPIFEIKGAIRNDSLGKDKVYDKSIVDLCIKLDTEDLNKLPDHCVSVADIGLEEQLKVLNVITGFVENNVSKTINAKNDITFEETKEMFYSLLDNYKNIKSVTFYRDGTRSSILSSERTSKDNVEYNWLKTLIKNNLKEEKLSSELMNTIDNYKKCDNDDSCTICN